jgi:hypothetical protein
MYYYACPYCAPHPKARLITVQSEHLDCKYDKEDYCKEKHKCKNVMQCAKCKEQWTINKDFLKKQKRKIKDG